MSGYDGAHCHCGGTWFHLEGEPPTTVGAVCLDANGLITGWSGHFVCTGCGDRWVPTWERLTVVSDDHERGHREPEPSGTTPGDNHD